MGGERTKEVRGLGATLREREKERRGDWKERVGKDEERQRRNGLDFTDFRILRFLGIALTCT